MSQGIHACPPETRPLNDPRASAIAIGAGLHAADAQLELLLFGINAMGVHIVHPGTRDVLRVFSFADIYRWGGTASLFSLVVWDTTRDTEVELQLWTREGPTIAGLVVEYINTIMEDRATPALPKRSQGTSASD